MQSKLTLPSITTKQKLQYLSYTREQADGLNWHGPSEAIPTNTLFQKAELKAAITQKGVYMIRLRSKENGSLGVANLAIECKRSGATDTIISKSYSNVPIYCSSLATELKGDSTTYNYSVTTFGSTDPMLFIESSRGNRIVEYGDDSTGSLGPKISREFWIAPSTAQVSNYSSLDAEGTCVLKIAEVTTNSSTNAAKRLDAESAGVETIIGSTKVSIYPNPVSLGGTIHIDGLGEIESIAAYSMNGSALCNLTDVKGREEINVSDMNITTSGIYILQISTGEGVESHKIIVK